MVKIRIIEVYYPDPDDDETDYCPDSEIISERDYDYTFLELIREMRDYSDCSNSHPIGDGREWLIDRLEDYQDGGWYEMTMHYARDNNPR